MAAQFDRRRFLQLVLAHASAAQAVPGSDEPEGAPPPQWAPQRAGTLSPLPTANTFLSQNARLAGWEQAFGKIVDDYGGGVYNPYWGALGALVFHGGGHSATFDNSVVILDLNDLRFKRLSQPTPSNNGANWTDLSGTSQRHDPAFDAVHCEYGDGQPGAGHTYDTLTILPPQDGGAPCGSLVRVASFAVHVNLSANAGWAHRFDFDCPSQRHGKWLRWSVNGPTSYLSPGACSAYDPLRKRIWWVAGLSSLPPLVRYLDVASREQVDVRLGRGAGLAPPANPDSATLRYDARHDCLLLSCTVEQYLVLAFLRCARPEQGWTVPPLSARIPALENTAHGFDWVDSTRSWQLLNPADPGALYEVLTPPVLESAWTVARRPVHGPALATSRVVGKRWSYVPAARAFVWMARSSSGVAAYRPPGT